MTGTITRTPCPQCHEVGGLYLDARIVAEPIGSHSLSGNQLKTTARVRPILKCTNCDLNLAGEFDGEHHASFDPPSQHTQDAPAAR